MVVGAVSLYIKEAHDLTCDLVVLRQVDGQSVGLFATHAQLAWETS